ncbi:glycoside hydrolase family 3 N-terminal domain-containing protein [Sulfurimonas sp.]|uniref:glycoside hydrolase family 3 N-terminal domain-containing protein n=1 Tax=Sulfurimonas sp. TaxID=2022749 RepID=UPI0025E94ECB|nr:glycoside hydrolase family 3 N-terminal domain-containing protein [Sulfurimonas sp.]MDD5157685.1 glycoside hydrolase family 3 N-terminal domain-containing protein [Sulfurimonas sp.]
MKQITLFLTLFFYAQILGAANLPDDGELKKMIGRMLVVGFEGESLNDNNKIIKDIKNYELGGVILFDRFYNDKTKIKNISSPEQLKSLTSTLNSSAIKPLLIAVDQEGGKVTRLKPAYGFGATPSAKVVSELSDYETKNIYTALANTLHEAGINCNFAPVVDLALNPENKVIYGLNRSYGSDGKTVTRYAKIFMDAQKNKQIISVLKHFPGHGSSLDDSHKGSVDISKTWSTVELEPYITLINSGDADMIMTAHVFNSNLDAKYPATLSYNTNTKLLREKLGFNGVIISDDMQMGAISSSFSLQESVALAINSGVDMLLFGNQLGFVDTDKLVEVILGEIKSGAIPFERIQDSNKRVELLLKKLKKP